MFRVHTLAKELSVSSKAIIEKCHAEGIDLKNHMAAISIGLAESIREWFSVGADITSVEFAEPVDVELARKTRRKLKKDADADAAVALEAPPDEVALGEVDAPPAESTLVPEPVPVEVAAEAESLALAATELALAAPGAAPIMAPPLEVVGLERAEPQLLETPAAAAAELAAQAAPAAEGESPSEGTGGAGPGLVTGTAPVEVALPPPPVVKPAGPQLVPAPAELRGPTLLRIEAPEPARVVRPRPAVARSATDERAPLRTVGPATRRPRGKGRKTEEEEAAAARSKSPRRHGAVSEVDQRLREWRDQDLLERKERLAAATGHGLRDRRAAERRRLATTPAGAPAARHDAISITTPVAIKEFCSAVGSPFSVISKKLVEHTGRLWTMNQTLDAELVEFLALDLGVTVEVAKAKTAYEKLEEEFATREHPDLQARPPVVTVLGHVDHGKTSLLDAIRNTHVAAGEAGGITQHIGAYRIDRGDWHVTFVDTPGHKAFTGMRARGANLTDVVVLVIAADDGVMPQTIEAMAHARAANVPIVVALNKIDLPGLDLNRVYSQLAEHGVAPAEWGGETDVIKTSATTGVGIDDLLSHLSTLSELLDLKADPTVPTHAIVIESQMREGRGVAAQVLVREGTLRPGQTVVCGPGAGRIRALRDFRGTRIEAAGPGTPVEVSGLDEMPSAGDRLYQVESLSRAKDIAREVRQLRREESLETAPKRTLEALVLSGAEADVPVLNVIVRADVQGSVEVLRKTLAEFPAEKARLNVLHAAVGAVSEADVSLAKASGATIIGFHVVPEDRARQLADQLGVEIRTYRVIYEVLDDLHKALVGLLAPMHREETRGSAMVQQVFSVSRVGAIAGCRVTDGVVARNHKVRVVRDGRIVTEGRGVTSLKRFKDDAREVKAGLDCGIKVQDFDDLKPGDVLQTYDTVEVAQEL